MVEAIIWKNEYLALIDQRELPFKKDWIHCHDEHEVADAIRDMVVRGAPAIGCTAAYGIVLAMMSEPTNARLQAAKEVLAASRPTAVNLFDALDYMVAKLGDPASLSDAGATALEAATAYHRDDFDKNKRIGKFGADFLTGKRRVLTHCNTGSLATSGWGTALGIIRQLHEEGRLEMVYADETRPYLQGARLTEWECREDGIPVTLVTDGMGGHLMTKGMVDCVIVGSDRIAANGDVANKIGTFMLAMAAKYHGIPFIVAAPTTTVDKACAEGKLIPIEQRDSREITHVRGTALAQAGTQVFNPAFDVTPADLVTAIITEEGLFQAPYRFDA